MRDARRAFYPGLGLLLLLAGCNQATEERPRQVEGPRVPLSEFSFPNEHQRALAPRLQLSREPRTHWTQQEIDEFWIPPREIGIEWIAEQADQEIEGLLKTIE